MTELQEAWDRVFAKAARLKREWLEAGRHPASLLIAPCVLDITAHKPARRSGPRKTR